MTTEHATDSPMLPDCGACDDTGTDIEEGTRCRCAEGQALKTSGWNVRGGGEWLVLAS